MNLTQLDTELSDRGFDDLSNTRRRRYLNQAYAEIANYAAWPFLETSTTKLHAGTFTDLGSILSVYNSTDEIELQGRDRDWIKQNVSADLTTTGTATYWYLTNLTFNVYPVDSTTSFTVYYLKVPAELTNDTDEPLIPDRFQDLIIDRAAIKGYKDNNNTEDWTALRQEYAADLEAMASHYFARNLQVPEQVLEIAAHE